MVMMVLAVCSLSFADDLKKLRLVYKGPETVKVHPRFDL